MSDQPMSPACMKCKQVTGKSTCFPSPCVFHLDRDQPGTKSHDVATLDRIRRGSHDPVRTAAMDALIADSADMYDAPAMVEVTDAVKADQCDRDAEKCCGSCRLYSNNMFADQPFMDRNRCHADAARDMPSSWKCNNYMNHRAGKDCPLWSAAQIERKPDAE